MVQLIVEKSPTHPSIRGMRRMIRASFHVITEMSIFGSEFIPSCEPLLVVANHFSFIEPAAVIHATPWLLEFVGGFHMSSTPRVAFWLR